MPADFNPDVKKKLLAAQCIYVRTGRHPIWYSPISKKHFPVPDNIKSRHTANAIMKQAGLEKSF
ncbi:MAG TPA: type II toxin-antitoxin system HicA family toxin [Acetobacteraceae bacterium]|nr:type II toxin-antitoxin system HicA family toxin [Acetobacteraceae bacterium]